MQKKQHGKPMSNSTDINTGYDAQVHFRAPSDFMPLVHLAARKQGMTASSFIRYTVGRELERLGISWAMVKEGSA